MLKLTDHVTLHGEAPCPLSAPVIKKLAGVPEKVAITRVAQIGAADLGLDAAGLLQVLLTLRHEDFYKSMSTYADRTVWQDVYRPKVSETVIYVKLTVISSDNLLVVSFKRK